MSLRLIIFDLDDTLWDAPPVLQAAELALQAWLAAHAPRLVDPAERLREQRRRLLEREPQLKGRVSELRRRMLRDSLGAAGYAEAEQARLAEQAFRHFLAARQQVRLFPEARPTLARLAERFTLGVLTNGNADVRRIGIADYFRFACSAEQLGVAKPDPRAFRAALARAGVSAQEAVHVGDHPRDDVAGALGAGLRAIWINPQGKAWEGEREPHAQIASLAELPALLESWQARR
ncbi:HAD family hydrolase [Pseudomonas stutzeri]|nr:HAD family hydrolase [Stutzerimonas stutzeri]